MNHQAHENSSISLLLYPYMLCQKGVSIMADELAAKLARRQALNAGEADPELPSTRFNPYVEFPVRTRGVMMVARG